MCVRGDEHGRRSCPVPVGPAAGASADAHPARRPAAWPAGPGAATSWGARRMPYRFTRGVRVPPTGDVECVYEATNTGADRVPFLWAPQPMLPLTSTTRLDLTPATRMHVYAQHEIAL